MDLSSSSSVPVATGWSFIGSIADVQKRNGSTQAYDIGKIEASIRKAFASADHKDEVLLLTITEHAVDQLQRTFDGTRVPRTIDIHDIVVKALSDTQLASVMEAFTRAQAAKVPKPAAVRPSGPVTPVPPSAFVPTPSSLSEISMSPSPSVPAPLTSSGETFTPRRRRLNDERKAVTHKFQVGKHEGYLTVGLYDDGQPGEIFVRMSKEGSVISGLMDAFATASSIGLQYGVPLKVLVNKFANMRFEPNGPTQNPNIPEARSIVDYIFRWMGLKFLTSEERQQIGLHGQEIDENTGESIDPLQVSLLDSVGTV